MWRPDVDDAELRKWWPDLGAVVADLRAGGHGDVADELVDAVRGGATSTEILGRVGLVFRDRRSVRSRLSPPAVKAWDAVLADVFRASPGERLSHWWARVRGLFG